MRLILVSNRLPFTVTAGREGEPPCFRPSPGGVTTGLASWVERWHQENPADHDYVWIGWAGGVVSDSQRPAILEEARRRYRAVPLFLEPEVMDRFYLGFCNRTIWPLFHYFTSHARFEESYWMEYLNVNQQFCEAVCAELRPGDTVWIHDYQLMLLPRMLRQRIPDLPIGFFLHIPFPSSEIFRLLPTSWQTQILEGLLGAGLVGFHTHDYTRHFLSCVQRILGFEHHLGYFTLPEWCTKVETFPMGIEYTRYASAAADPATAARAQRLRDAFRGQKIIFSVDRLDYTKGLLQRLRGYELFLRQHPEWHQRVVFILVVAPSRTGVDAYHTMKRELEQLVGSIQGQFSRENWSPVIYQYRALDFHELVVRYRAADVGLITPLRDGMNLVAKEFVACRTDQTGCLVLSELAGAAREMGEALVVNPWHPEEVAGALERALTLPEDEQKRRMAAMQARLQRYDVHRWAGDFLQALQNTEQRLAPQRARTLSPSVRDQLLSQYATAQSRVLLLDYDGTLVEFRSDPGAAAPDSQLLELLQRLASDPANHVALVSGRPRTDLEKWFNATPLTLAAEHGLWIRPAGEAWRMPVPVKNDWKDQIRPILQLYADRLPGAFVEEKEFSLALHYRRSDPDLASQRAKELCDDLADFTRNIEVQVLRGHKVVEVRHVSAHKGLVITTWVNALHPDFVLGIGDDWTDEDLFQSLPPGSWSIRVGLAPTAALYYLPHPRAVRSLLETLAATSTQTPARAFGSSSS